MTKIVFYYLCLSIFFTKGYTKPIKGYFSHTGCPKNENPHILVEKNEIYGHDQNIGSPEKFCLSDAVNFGSLFSKMDTPSQ